ncbi:hypothetical protein CsSME_00044481 [Camellia sinensis var. sinensis]
MKTKARQNEELAWVQEQPGQVRNDTMEGRDAAVTTASSDDSAWSRGARQSRGANKARAS